MELDEMREKLINNDFNDIRQELLETGGCAYLYDILSGGWAGYYHLSRDELKMEYDCRFEHEIEE